MPRWIPVPSLFMPVFCYISALCAAKVVTGSFQGMLRIYNPRERDFKIEDLMLEQNLEEPILQLEAGYFSSYVTYLPYTNHKLTI
jgi:hypothetical protein